MDSNPNDEIQPIDDDDSIQHIDESTTIDASVEEDVTATAPAQEEVGVVEDSEPSVATEAEQRDQPESNNDNNNNDDDEEHEDATSNDISSNDGVPTDSPSIDSLVDSSSDVSSSPPSLSSPQREVEGQDEVPTRETDTRSNESSTPLTPTRTQPNVTNTPIEHAPFALRPIQSPMPTRTNHTQQQSSASPSTTQQTPPARPPLPVRTQQQQQQPQQSPQSFYIPFDPIPYVPSALPSGVPASGPAADGSSSFWDMFSSSAPRAKLSRDLVDWAPDLTVPPPFTTLAPDWTKLASNLDQQDHLTGHLPPYALRFGFVDELGEFHPMLDWGDAGSGGSGMGGGSSKQRTNKYTARAKEAAKDILSSIQHHRVGQNVRTTRSSSIGGAVVLNGKVAQSHSTQQPHAHHHPTHHAATPQTAPSPAHAAATVSGTTGSSLSVGIPSTPVVSGGFSPPPSLPHGNLNAATNPTFPRADLPDTNWWLLTSGDGI